VTERWILNASPMIVLARVGYEDLCLKLADSVVVPQAVATEIEAGPEPDPTRQALAARRFDVVRRLRPLRKCWPGIFGQVKRLSYREGWPSQASP
jgi:hypothetical protein